MNVVIELSLFLFLGKFSAWNIRRTSFERYLLYSTRILNIQHLCCYSTMASKKVFGKLADGTVIDLYELKTSKGMVVQVRLSAVKCKLRGYIRLSKAYCQMGQNFVSVTSGSQLRCYYQEHPSS